ncbi:LytTR family DNA-binding domain-containing protein [uncultured Arcticibacterium sp.]|uniref:LytR/AlgR family response regulator transcription factor n=1 Tax=uncultured Arcticibacterium sp. TaxID=2173042 RepID=UPI0030FA75A6
MKKYSAVLIDDEAHCIRTLEQQLAWVTLPIDILGKASSVKEALAVLKKQTKTPTFIFLDIHMGDEDGFSLLEQADLKGSHIVFTTAFEQYALEAFKHRASGYLTKPISTDELELLLKSLVSKNELTSGSQTLKINTRNGQEVLNLKEIHYAEADGSYSKLYLENGTTRVVSKNLKGLSELLAESHFVRIHSKYLINIHKIKKVSKGDKPYVLLKSVTELPISRSRKEEVYKLIEAL